MQRTTKIIALLAVIAIGAFGTDLAFGQSDGVFTSDQTQFIEIIAVSSAIGGALVSVANGAANSTTPFSVKKFISAMITAIIGSMFLVNLGALPQETGGMTLFAIVLTYFIIGWGGDKGLSKLDKDK